MTPRIRCAVYTRKSSEEGLEQSFNSLHAQREACEAFIRSQKHEGWTLIATKYDDGGFSGGNMERPALRALIADIAEGKVNTVVVYKVDRLTRSLADFAKIIEQFDSRGVSFVSLTQTLKRCPKFTCIANVGFQQMLFKGPGTHCPHCGAELELVAPPRRRSTNKGGTKSGGKSVGGKTVSRASSSPTLGIKKKRRKVAQKKTQFKTWDSFLKPEPRKSARRKDVGRKRGSK